MAWVILAVIGLLMVFLVTVALRGLMATGRVARDAGWKRIFPGVYLSGPHGDAHVEPGLDTHDRDPSQVPLRRAGRRPWPILLTALVVPVAFPVAGGLISVAQGQTLIAGIALGFLAAFLLIGAAWIGLGMRAAGKELRGRRN